MGWYRGVVVGKPMRLRWQGLAPGPALRALPIGGLLRRPLPEGVSAAHSGREVGYSRANTASVSSTYLR